MKQTAQDEVHEREQHRVPPRQAGESAMLADDAAQRLGHDFCTPHGANRYVSRVARCSRIGYGMPFNSTSPTSTNRIDGSREDRTTPSLTKTCPGPA